MRKLKILGSQGFAEYAMDDQKRLWYRFTIECDNPDKSWKLVAY